MQLVDHSKNIIEVHNLTFGYNGQTVLKDINLNIHRGDYLGLVGGNGSGKTTLVKLMLGLLKPDAGTIKLFDQPIKDFRDWSKIGYVPQTVTHFESGFPATVEEVVLMGRYGKLGLFHSPTRQDQLKAKVSLQQVGMWDQRERLIGDLSGGQQQRVFIARALAGEPEVIFLDEPTVGVEKRVSDEFYALLRKLNRELHLTVILITHDIESMSHEAMHIACIDRTLFFHNSVDEYFKSTHQVIHPHS